MPKKPRISLIVAIGTDSQGRAVIGKTNELLWYIPEDLKRFKALTLGHPVIMGRKTYDSIIGMLKKPLPGRTSIIVTRTPSNLASNLSYTLPNTMLTSSVEEAITKASELDTEEIFVIGGAQIYEQALPLADRLYVTLIDDAKEGDAYFPEYETVFTKVVKEEHQSHGVINYTWVDLERE